VTRSFKPAAVDHTRWCGTVNKNKNRATAVCDFLFHLFEANHKGASCGFYRFLLCFNYYYILLLLLYHYRHYYCVL